jgi:methionyl aminopeptidase
MITLKSEKEINKIRKAGAVVAEILERIQKRIEVGMTTDDLNELTSLWLREYDSAEPAFLGYRGFPKNICVSINDEVVHGIPSPHRKIQKGDVVSLDFGVCMAGYYADAALTFQVPPREPAVEHFLGVCREALGAGVAQAIDGNRIGNISSAIQETVESNAFQVVRSLVGHGIGKNLHEEPQIPNFGTPEEGVLLHDGMVLAIEPMINMGGSEVRTLDDEWTIVTMDGSLSAHFEHTIVVTRNGPEILTIAGERMATGR